MLKVFQRLLDFSLEEWHWDKKNLMINVILSSERQVKASSQENVQGVAAPPVVEGWQLGHGPWSWAARGQRSGWHSVALPNVFSLGEAVKGSWLSIAALCILFEEREWSDFMHYNTLSVLLCKYKIQFFRLTFLHRCVRSFESLPWLSS